jgi:PilZ domain
MNGSMIKARIAEDDPSDRRQGPRYPVDVEGKVRELGSEGSEARILNISEKGFMAESSGEYEVGSRVWLMLPGRDRASAIVRWTAGHRLGAEFAEPIALDDLPN